MSTAKSYAEIFTTAGASYHQAMKLCPHARDAEFGAAIDLIPLYPGQCVLDIPAGGGYLQRYLPEHIGYTAYDFSAAFSHNDLIEKCDENTFPAPARRYDHAICLAALHHIQDRSGFFNEIKRVLKPNGHFVLGDVLSGSPQDEFLNGFVNQWSDRGHQGDFIQVDREITELKKLGFTAEQKQKRFDWHFAHRAQARKFMRLLFSLDKDPSNELLDQQLDHLGYAGMSLPWSLAFISAKLEDR